MNKYPIVKKHPTVDLLVDDRGNVYSLNGDIRALQDYGYLKVMVGGKSYAVHRLVAETFIPNPENKECVDHINNDRHDNYVNNLRWATNKENASNRDNIAHNKKPVDVYTVYGDFVRSFDSIQGVADCLGVKRSNVTVNMKRNGATSGYYVMNAGDVPPNTYRKITGC